MRQRMGDGVSLTKYYAIDSRAVPTPTLELHVVSQRTKGLYFKLLLCAIKLYAAVFMRDSAYISVLTQVQVHLGVFSA